MPVRSQSEAIFRVIIKRTLRKQGMDASTELEHLPTGILAQCANYTANGQHVSSHLILPVNRGLITDVLRVARKHGCDGNCRVLARSETLYSLHFWFWKLA